MRALNSPGKLAVLAVVCATMLASAGLALATEAGSYAKALAQAKAENKLVLIDFYTDW